MYDIKDLSILQWNVNRWTQKNYKFREDAIRHLNPDIICINETKLRGDETIELADNEFFGHNRLKLKTTATCGSGGVAFLIKSSLAYKFYIICVDKLYDGILCLKLMHTISLNEFLICTCYTRQTQFQFKIGENKIEIKETYEYLGCILSETLQLLLQRLQNQLSCSWKPYK